MQLASALSQVPVSLLSGSLTAYFSSVSGVDAAYLCGDDSYSSVRLRLR